MAVIAPNVCIRVCMHILLIALTYNFAQCLDIAIQFQSGGIRHHQTHVCNPLDATVKVDVTHLSRKIAHPLPHWSSLLQPEHI